MRTAIGRNGCTARMLFAAVIALSSGVRAQPPPPTATPTPTPERSPFTGELLPPNVAPVPPVPPASPQPPASAPPASAPSASAPPPVSPAPGAWVPAPNSGSYVLVPPGYQAPFELPYRPGVPVPAGYRLVEEPIRGLLISGWLVTGIGYGMGVMGAAVADFANESSWMLVPVIGPWLTLGAREYYSCKHEDSDGDGRDDADPECTQDALVILGLALNGMMQGAGAALLFMGYSIKKKKLIREDMHVGIAPGRVTFAMRW